MNKCEEDRQAKWQLHWKHVGHFTSQKNTTSSSVHAYKSLLQICEHVHSLAQTSAIVYLKFHGHRETLNLLNGSFSERIHARKL